MPGLTLRNGPHPFPSSYFKNHYLVFKNEQTTKVEALADPTPALLLDVSRVPEDTNLHKHIARTSVT